MNYHVTARCINREWFAIPIQDVWSLYEDYLYFLIRGFNFKINSFVLMNNHFHMLVRCPDNNLPQGMQYFMRETSRWIGRQSGRINQVYGGPYHKSEINFFHHFLHAYKYVYRNPIEAGLCQKVEDYPYSTLHFLKSQTPNLITTDDEFIFDDLGEHLHWLNTPYIEDHMDQIKNALRKPEFKFAKNKLGKKSSLDSEMS